MAKCTVYKEVCEKHGFVHGGEAEELRSGIEKILSSDKSMKGWVATALTRLLDRVDARDSVAFRFEAESKEKDDE